MNYRGEEMNELNGYVKIHRKLLQWGWYQDHAVKEVWLHLLLTASFRECKYRGKTILPGQCVVGTEQMAKDLGFTRQQVRTAIKKLNSTNEITIETTNKFSIVTLVNWAEYQLKENPLTNKITNTLTNNQPTNNQQITNNQPHRKNVKNVKNVKKSVCTHAHDNNSQSEKSSFAEFVTMTNAEYEALIEKFGETDAKRMIELLDNYKGSHGVEYSSDYRTILSWVKDKLREEKQKAKGEPENLYSDNFNHTELEKLTRRSDQ